MPERTGAGDLGRRDVLRRAALLGGATAWAVPTVQTLSGSAWAATRGSTEVESTKSPKPGASSPDVEVQGTKIPHTGTNDPAPVLLTGAGLVAAGAATVAIARRRAGTGVAADKPTPKHRRH